MKVRILESNHSGIEVGDIGELKQAIQNPPGYEVEFTKDFWHGPTNKTKLDTRSIFFPRNAIEFLPDAETKIAEQIPTCSNPD